MYPPGFDVGATTQHSSQVRPAVPTMVAVTTSAPRPQPARSALVDQATSSIATVSLVLVSVCIEAMQE